MPRRRPTWRSVKTGLGSFDRHLRYLRANAGSARRRQATTTRADAVRRGTPAASGRRIWEAVFQAVLKDTGGNKSAARAAALEAQEDVNAVDAARTGRTAAMTAATTACPGWESAPRMPRCGACAACATAERAVAYCADTARLGGGGGGGDFPHPCEPRRCTATMVGPQRTKTIAALAAQAVMVQCREAAGTSHAVVVGCTPRRSKLCRRA